MGKTREYSNDVRQKVVETHKSGNGLKKIAQRLKMPISTIRAIMKKCKATGDVNDQPGKRTCVYIDTTHSEEDILSGQTSPRITAGKLQLLIGFWGRKVSKLRSDITYVTTSCLGGLP